MVKILELGMEVHAVKNGTYWHGTIDSWTYNGNEKVYTLAGIPDFFCESEIYTEYPEKRIKNFQTICAIKKSALK